MGVEKRRVARGGKISFSEGGGGINIIFGPKYRPLFVNEIMHASEKNNNIAVSSFNLVLYNCDNII
jgi:hypothetical protein